MEYRIAQGWRTAAIVFALAFIAGGIALITSPLYNENMHKTPLLGVVLGIIAGVIGWALWTDTIQSKIIIDDYSINQIGAFKRKSLLLDEIAGYRKVKDYYILVSKSGQSMQISNYIENKEDFIAWMKDKYRDADEVIVEEETKEILADESFGTSEDDRKHLLKQATTTSRAFNIAAAAVSFWLLIYPSPYQLAWAAVLLVPPASLYILWRFKGLVTINDNRKGQKSAYPSMLPALLFSCILIIARASIDFKPYGFTAAFKYAIGIGAVLTAITYYIAYTLYPSNINKKPVIFGLALLFLAYGYGATIFVNCHFDTSNPEIFTESVTYMRISKGKSTSYYITTTPWGRYTQPEEVSVSRSLYQGLQLGDSVNIYLQPGKLGIPWYFLDKK